MSKTLELSSDGEGSFCSHGHIVVSFIPDEKVRVTCSYCDEIVAEGLPEEVFVPLGADDERT